MQVDLPEPLGPMMATNSPSLDRRDRCRGARATAASPSPIDLGQTPPGGSAPGAPPGIAVARHAPVPLFRGHGVGDEQHTFGELALQHFGGGSVTRADGDRRPPRARRSPEHRHGARRPGASRSSASAAPADAASIAGGNCRLSATAVCRRGDSGAPRWGRGERSSPCASTISAVAVIPGRSDKSALSTERTAL